MSRILNADDDPLQLDFRKMLLESAGHEVVSAVTARQTLGEIERAVPDVLIMDLRFPNGEGEPDSREGMDLIRRVRGAGCTVPIIVLSGWPEELYGEPEERMVSRIMLKPVKPAELLDAVRKVTICAC
jgi:CheY-like chemotaxis protein